jgi:hypothetical protein
MNLEVELSLSTRFSNSFYDNNFQAACSVTGASSKVGVSYILSDRFSGTRFLHWRAGGGFVCLHEVWLNQDLDDNALCLRLGGKILRQIANVLKCIHTS